ncbi:MAG TPA: hypothetical protein VHP33_21735 [Polyangiaceae bacterium]|nr:hypothetical protein [Polyangiaceae bacterium]
MNRQLFGVLVLGALGATSLGGCKFLKKKAPEEAPSAVAAASAAPAPVALTPTPASEPAAPVAAVEPPLDEASVPAPQDFEDEAFEKVTTANFKTELARLNKEISAPPAAP